jgi:hypothetical protein
MTAIVYQIRDYQKPKPTLEQQADKFMSDITRAILEGEKTIYESKLGYIAEEKDPA